MSVYIDDSLHIFTVFAFINIVFYLLNASHYWHHANETFICHLLWYMNIGLILLMVWNMFWEGTTLFSVSSGWMTVVAAILFGIFAYITIGSSIALLQLIVVFGLFVVILIGGHNYVIAFFNNQVTPVSQDYVYVGIALAILVILWIVYIKFVRGRRTVEIIMTDLTLSWIVANGIQILRYEDASSGFNNTTVPVFDYDYLFFVGFIILFIAFLIIYYFTQPKDKEQEKETPTTEPVKQIDQEQTVTISTPTPTTETSPSNESSTLLPEDESSGPTPTSTAAKLKLSRWNKFRHHRCG